MTKQWASILGFEGSYSISRNAEVLSEERYVENHGKREGIKKLVRAKILSQHKFTEENTLHHRNGKKRTCRTCHTNNTRKIRARKKAA